MLTPQHSRDSFYTCLQESWKVLSPVPWSIAFCMEQEGKVLFLHSPPRMDCSWESTVLPWYCSTWEKYCPAPIAGNAGCQTVHQKKVLQLALLCAGVMAATTGWAEGDGGGGLRDVSLASSSSSFFFVGFSLSVRTLGVEPSTENACWGADQGWG